MCVTLNLKETDMANFAQNLVFSMNFKISLEYSNKFCTLFGISKTDPNKIFLSNSYFTWATVIRFMVF